MTKFIEQPGIVFDSRHARKIYKDYSYYRSAGFVVPPGYVAVVELITNHTYVPTLTFTAVRQAAGSTLDACYGSKNCLGKRYRRWQYYQGLGVDIPNTDFDDYNASVVRWGWDYIKERLVEHEYIVRPGHYYLMGDRCSNENIEDCENPTLFEVTLVPSGQPPELLLPNLSLAQLNA